MTTTNPEPRAPLGDFPTPLMFMIDIETQGNLYGAPILSVGVAAYLGAHHEEPFQSREYYPAIRPEAEKRICPETMAWWMQNATRLKNYQDLMQQRAGAPRLEAEPLAHALHSFMFDSINLYNQNLAPLTTPAGNGNVQWWCKGPQYDIAHLDVYLHPYAGPWEFWNVRDYRTYLKTANDGVEPIGQDQRQAHTAQGDALHQLANLVEIMEHRERRERLADAQQAQQDQLAQQPAPAPFPLPEASAAGDTPPEPLIPTRTTGA